MPRSTCLLTGALLFSCAHRPPSPAADEHVRLGSEYLSSDQCDQAEAQCRLALEFDNNHAGALNCAGLIALRCRGNIEVAAQRFKDALAADENFVAAHVNLGAALLLQAPPDLTGATERFEAALELAPYHADARENLIDVLIRRASMEDPKLGEEARSQALRLIEIDGQRAAAWRLYAGAEILAGRAEEAERALLRCLELDPNEVACLYQLGEVLIALHRCEEGMTALRRAAVEGSRVAIEARRAMVKASEPCRVWNDALVR